MTAILKHWREAATIILVAKGASTTDNVAGYNSASQKYKYDILMLKRSSKSKFMPNLYVFPGGVAQDVDFSKEWLNVFRESQLDRLFSFVKRGGTGQPMFSRRRSPEFESIPSELAFRICAIRETFEESGILLVRNADNLLKSSSLSDAPLLGNTCDLSDEVLKSWRQKVNKDANEFLNMCRELDVVPDVWALNEWSNWLTPVRISTGEIWSGKRFDTAFYLCVLDHMPLAVQDNTETVHAQWSSPDKLIRDYMCSEASLAPPQVYELCRILNFTDAEKLNEFAWNRAKTCNRVERYFPVPCICSDGVAVVYPGDELFPDSPDYEGKDPLITYDLTLEELKEKYPKMNRTSGAPTGELMVNVRPGDGHVIPMQNLSSVGLPITAKL